MHVASQAVCIMRGMQTLTDSELALLYSTFEPKKRLAGCPQQETVGIPAPYSQWLLDQKCPASPVWLLGCLQTPCLVTALACRTRR